MIYYLLYYPDLVPYPSIVPNSCLVNRLIYPALWIIFYHEVPFPGKKLHITQLKVINFVRARPFQSEISSSESSSADR